MIHHHPDRREELVFRYRRTGWRSSRIDVVEPVQGVRTLEVHARRIGILCDRDVFEGRGVRAPSLPVLFGRLHPDGH